MKVFTQIPRTRPVTPLLDTVNVPEDLRELSPGELPRLADERREYLLYNKIEGFAFLVDTEEGWSLVRPLTGAPVSSQA
jgi:hypothetical protein